MRSIGARLGISLFISLLLAGVLVGQAALWWLDREQRQITAGQLRDEAASVLAWRSMGWQPPAGKRFRRGLPIDL